MECINATINTELSAESQEKIKDMVAAHMADIVETIEGEEVTRPATAADVSDEDLCELVCKQVCLWVDKNEVRKASKPPPFSEAS